MADESEIKFKVRLDENKLPREIGWEASDAGEAGTCKSVMIAMWDAGEQNTLRMDLWTSDMLVDEMKQFFHQNLLTMADSFQRATGEKEMMDELRAYCNYFAQKMDILPKGPLSGQPDTESNV
ncbi:MAG: gliding motility protein GldC [Bacteroidia bacterium]|nr:gliding motility protein GldC [Bacteroidia bacterium]